MSLRSRTGDETQIFVMPAWIAGIQVCKMLPETSMSAWIPALHAGMTESKAELTEGHQPVFLKEEERTRHDTGRDFSSIWRDCA